MSEIKEMIEYTNECYHASTRALNEMIANLAPAPHCQKPIGAYFEEMKQCLASMQMNTKIILIEFNKVVKETAITEFILDKNVCSPVHHTQGH